MTFPARRKNDLLNDPGLTILPPGPGWGSFALTMALVVALLWGFVERAERLIEKDGKSEEAPAAARAMSANDKHGINLALRAKALQKADDDRGVVDSFMHWLPQETDGETGPLWPWIMSRMAEEDHPLQPRMVMDGDYTLLQRGKRAHVWMTVAFMGALGLIAAKSVSPPAVALILFSACWGALLPAAVRFEPSVLYCLLLFLSWVCALRLLLKNNVWLHAIFGALSGLAWLTDTTAWIVMAAWLVASSLRWLRGALRREEGPPDEAWSCRNHFVGLVAVALGWLAVCGPRCALAGERWGQPFFAWQQHWMWTDGGEDYASSRALVRQVVAPSETISMPAETPTLEDWHRTHTTEQVKERLWAGWSEAWRTLLCPKDRHFGTHWPEIRGLVAGVGLLIFAGTSLLAATRRKTGNPSTAPPEGISYAVLFVVFASAGYGLWYGWYAPVEAPDRSMPVLYLPLVFSLIWGAENRMVVARAQGGRPGWQVACQAILWLTLAVAVAGAVK